jgi:eukaryotic-like serine/threonine-protein kinase
MLGKTLNNYQLVRLLGQGGMGSVYEALDSRTGKRVAIKILHSVELTKNSTCVSRFRREAEVANTIATPHIVPVVETGTDPETGAPFMVMEHLIGEDLHHVIRRLGPLPPAVVLRIAAQTCEGLKKAHAAGVIHRDIKPANLFLSQQEDGRLMVKILDFGIAKIKLERDQLLEGSALTRSGNLLGSPLYMSPEQVRGAKRVDERADLWSLGVVLYRALSGHAPHEELGAFGDLIIAICSEVPRPLQEAAPWVPYEVAALVHRALNLEPGDRFQSAAEMLAAINALLPGGAEIDPSMIVALKENERTPVAPEIELPTLIFCRPIHYTPASISAISAMADTQLTSAATALPARLPSAPSPPRPLSLWRLALSAGIASSLGSLAVLAALHSGPFSVGATAATASPLEPALPVPALAAAKATPVAAKAAPSFQPVKLAITGAVSVQVEGVAVTLRDGTVELPGKPGSVHRVRLVNGTREGELDVVITSAGPQPKRLDLAELTAPQPAPARP